MDSLTDGLRNLGLQFVPFMLAVVVHEFGHGWMASLWGDQTAKKSGRLTLNPLPHIDFLGTLVFPILMMVSGSGVLFGWARPVPIDPTQFKRYRPGLFLVALAGPLMNFIFAALSAFAFFALDLWVSPDFYLQEPLKGMALVSVYLNIAIGFFNLLPLPPLDGSKMVQSFLSLKATLAYERMARYSFFIFLALIFTGAMRFLIEPIRWTAEVLLGLMALLMGAPLV